MTGSANAGRRLAGVVAVLLLAGALRGVGAGAGLAQEAATVTVGDDFFEANSITIAPGTTVAWTTAGANGHTVTSDTGVFDSGVDPFLRQGDSFSFTFTEEGTYPYYCRFHGGPGGVAMAGTVVVEAPERAPVQGPPPSPVAPTSTPARLREDGDGGSDGGWVYAAAAAGGALLLGGAAAAWWLRRRT